MGRNAQVRKAKKGKQESPTLTLTLPRKIPAACRKWHVQYNKDRLSAIITCPMAERYGLALIEQVVVKEGTAYQICSIGHKREG